jgi:phosphatidylglycerol:prolipoprotein diacylglycerol transferase
MVQSRSVALCTNARCRIRIFLRTLAICCNARYCRAGVLPVFAGHLTPAGAAMPFAIPFPDLSPEIFTLEVGGFAFALRWYAMAYIAGLGFAWGFARWLVNRSALWPAGRAPMSAAQVEDFMTWAVLGVVLGGRLGYVLFYQPAYYMAHPAEILMVWQGGMSFHGGFLGVVVAGAVYAWRHGLPWLGTGDLIAIVVPVGLMLGRIANFINAELWGRPTDVPWGVIFPGQAAQACATVAGPCVRHPSQLYQAGLEGLVLFTLLVVLALRFRAFLKPGVIMGTFIAGYGAARMVAEGFRQADAQYITADNPMGHVIAGLTMGQILSLPMLLVGLCIIIWAARRA